MKISVQKAGADLTKLIHAALAGEEVVITEGDTPLAKIVPIKGSSFQIGMLEGQLGEVPDFFEPMSDEDLSLWEGRP
ncbi:MAG: type II toxin-antitoxin system prevent-host-death family antitoxin [Devosia sp.]